MKKAVSVIVPVYNVEKIYFQNSELDIKSRLQEHKNYFGR